jgi:hypothetical protein
MVEVAEPASELAARVGQATRWAAQAEPVEMAESVEVEEKLVCLLVSAT